MLALGACSDQFRKEDLVGKYVLNTGPYIDTLELKSDGNYVHAYQPIGSEKETLSGKWQLDETAVGQYVTLNDHRPLPSENSSSRGFYLLRATRFFGSIRLVRNDDLNEFYRKE